MLKSRVIQYGIREMRRQEVVRKEVKCFGCREKEHKKWEYLNMRKRKQEEVTLPQRV